MSRLNFYEIKWHWVIFDSKSSTIYTSGLAFTVVFISLRMVSNDSEKGIFWFVFLMALSTRPLSQSLNPPIQGAIFTINDHLIPAFDT